MSDLLVFAFLFFIGSCLGWGMEVIFRKFFSRSNPQRKWINPGFLTGPYLPLYGFGLWGMYFVSYLSKIAMTGIRAVDTVLILMIMAVVMTVIEYIAGVIFIRGMKVKLWDYSHERGNIQGIICPKFTLAWGILGCFYYFVVNPYVIGWVVWLSHHLAFSFFIGMFFGVFLIDVCYSISLGTSVKKFAEEKQIVVKYEELKEFMRQQREQFMEKQRFIFAFKTGRSFRQDLESFIELKIKEKAGQEIGRIRQFNEKVSGKVSEKIGGGTDRDIK